MSGVRRPPATAIGGDGGGALNPSCDLVGAWMLKSDGTIVNAQTGKGNASAVTCLGKGDVHGNGLAVEVRPCNPGDPTQKWTVTAVGSTGAYTVEQSGTCIDNNFVWSGKN